MLFLKSALMVSIGGLVATIIATSSTKIEQTTALVIALGGLSVAVTGLMAAAAAVVKLYWELKRQGDKIENVASHVAKIEVHTNSMSERLEASKEMEGLHRGGMEERERADARDLAKEQVKEQVKVEQQVRADELTLEIHKADVESVVNKIEKVDEKVVKVDAKAAKIQKTIEKGK